MRHSHPLQLTTVDNGKLQIYAGINLSFLCKRSQKAVYKYFYRDKKCAIDVAKSELIKQAYGESKTLITIKRLKEMFARKSDYTPVKPFTVSGYELREFADEIPNAEAFARLFVEFLREECGVRGLERIGVTETTGKKMF